MIGNTLNLNNLAIRHVNLPNLGPVFLVDNFGLVSAASHQGVIEIVAQYLQTHRQPKLLSNLVTQFINTGIVQLLATVNHSAYAIYKMERRWGVEIIGTGVLYKLASQSQVFEVLGDADARSRSVATRISVRNSLPEPVYVGFTAEQHPQVRLPMTLGLTRMPAKAGSKATWDNTAIAEALDNATQSEPKDDNEAKLRSKLTAMLKEYEDINTENRPALLADIIESVKEIESLYLRQIQVTLESGLGPMLSGRGQSPYWLGSMGNEHYQHPMSQLFQFPQFSSAQEPKPSLTSVLRQIQQWSDERRAENESAGTVKKPGFGIKHLNDFSSVVTDKTFGGTLTLYYANAEEKDKLFERLSGLVELILTGENHIKFSSEILEKGVQDIWVFENVAITGPVLLAGRMVVSNIELNSGNFAEATLVGSK